MMARAAGGLSFGCSPKSSRGGPDDNQFSRRRRSAPPPLAVFLPLPHSSAPTNQHTTTNRLGGVPGLFWDILAPAPSRQTSTRTPHASGNRRFAFFFFFFFFKIPWFCLSGEHTGSGRLSTSSSLQYTNYCIAWGGNWSCHCTQQHGLARKFGQDTLFSIFPPLFCDGRRLNSFVLQFPFGTVQFSCLSFAFFFLLFSSQA
ncbi:hypothetical protein B0J12DRAFT_100407 [Macrophomina phaseolina]|uniref:Uncharacterized protein n=1 Tax=Macrophomina phaseolina TaxID=35725 RepID=A0ABQ8GA11_9PEZI|nr:hypothetical protein B0J12DRAFT_100407 [Macrophomina phaseolina]